jgi:hypothetical protein
MDLIRLRAISRYWEKYPPLHTLVAGALGVGSSKPETAGDVFPELPEFEP